ncbi:heat shock protein 21 [Penaeus vannamei]|uniref:Heat shock protein 21 n=1 Tax=Penaeus vannamei TaxID=6689 RepID=A0A3R7NAR4_PENVA|nr:heat shock protein 21 [Penaeus vannamei]
MSLLQSFASGQPVSESGVKCCNCGGVRRPWDMFLPITHRGSFFQDSFFSNLHQHFHATVRDILNRWCDSDLKLTDPWDDVNARHTDILDRYRQLRSRNLKEENQAVAVTSDDTSRKESEAQHKTTIIPIQMEETQDKNASEGTSSESFKCEQCSQTQTSVNGGKQGRKYSSLESDAVIGLPVEILRERQDVPLSVPGHFFHTSYRNLRSRDLREDTQAVTSSEDEHQHKHSTLQIEEVFSPISIDGSEKKLTSPGATKDNSQYALHNGQGSPEAPPTMPSGATASPVSQQIFTGQNPDSPNKEDSYPHVTSAEGMHVPPDPQPPSFPAPLKRVSTKPKGKEANEGAEEKVDYQAETPKPSSSSAPSKSVSVKPKSFDRKGREGSEEEEKVDYQAALKPRTAGGKFPIKISGTVINSNAV